jgi:hypothetical protein
MSNTNEKTLIVRDTHLDTTEAHLEAKGYDVCGEKTLPGQRTEIVYRPDPDKQKVSK